MCSPELESDLICTEIAGVRVSRKLRLSRCLLRFLLFWLAVLIFMRTEFDSDAYMPRGLGGGGKG